MHETVSVIIRTMPGREIHLDRCLFILSGQTWRNFEPVVIVQKKDESSEILSIEAIVGRWRNRFFSMIMKVHAAEFDARSRSLNLGKMHAGGRYIAFLDDDDKVYPDHYENLVNALKKSKFAWAYADTVRGLYNEFGQLISRSLPFQRRGYSFLDHLRGNFIPIHSFLIDRERVPDLGDVEESMNRNEDYDFLLRLAFRHEPLCLKGSSAEYCIRSDGTNTVTDGTAGAADFLTKRRLWNSAQDILEERKLKNFGWWVRELTELPMVYGDLDADGGRAAPKGSYRELLRNYYGTRSWRVTKPIRNVIRFFRGQGPEVLVIPESEEYARIMVERVLTSTSWELTAPLRLVRRLVDRLGVGSQRNAHASPVAPEEPGNKDAVVASNPVTATGPTDSVLHVPPLVHRTEAGVEMVQEDVMVGALSLSREWAYNNVDLGLGSILSFFHARGDAMSPTIEDGDILLVDNRDRERLPVDGLYVMANDVGMFVKRVAQQDNGGWRLSNDNPEAEAQEAHDSALRPLGYVVWIWRGKKPH